MADSAEQQSNKVHVSVGLLLCMDKPWLCVPMCCPTGGFSTSVTQRQLEQTLQPRVC